MTNTFWLAAVLTASMATAQSPTPTESGTSPGPTLVDGWYWVRAVAAPNFHSYLQSQPTGVAAPAHLDAPAEAGQFNIIEGQLVYNTGAGGELYLHVERPDDLSQRALATYFEREPSSWGEFSFQGDTVAWNAEGLQRPNTAAWFVCEDQKLYVNTGPYGYQTPEGCADQTVSSSCYISRKS